MAHNFTGEEAKQILKAGRENAINWLKLISKDSRSTRDYDLNLSIVRVSCIHFLAHLGKFANGKEGMCFDRFIQGVSQEIRTEASLLTSELSPGTTPCVQKDYSTQFEFDFDPPPPNGA